MSSKLRGSAVDVLCLLKRHTVTPRTAAKQGSQSSITVERTELDTRIPGSAKEARLPPPTSSTPQKALLYPLLKKTCWLCDAGDRITVWITYDERSRLINKSNDRFHSDGTQGGTLTVDQSREDEGQIVLQFKVDLLYHYYSTISDQDPVSRVRSAKFYPGPTEFLPHLVIHEPSAASEDMHRQRGKQYGRTFATVFSFWR